MTVDRKLNIKLDHQIALWMQRQERSLEPRQIEELCQLIMEVVYDEDRRR